MTAHLEPKPDADEAALWRADFCRLHHLITARNEFEQRLNNLIEYELMKLRERLEALEAANG